jgi:hypothetical protein
LAFNIKVIVIKFKQKSNIIKHKYYGIQLTDDFFIRIQRRNVYFNVHTFFLYKILLKFKHIQKKYMTNQSSYLTKHRAFIAVYINAETADGYTFYPYDQ